MKFGLEVQVIENIISVLEQYPKVDKAFVFGSRAKGNYCPDSDIDIAIKGYEITTDDIIAISVAIEAKGIRHKFDLIDYDSIKEPALKEHIDRVGIEFYSRWKEIALGDVIDVKHGYAFNGKHIAETPTNNILVTPGNFHIGGGFKSAKYKYYNSDFPTDYILKPNDIVVTMTDLSQETDTLGYSAKIPKQDGINYLHNQRIGLVQFKSNDVDKDFIYWVLRTKEYQGFIVGSASGTSIMHTAPTRIKEYSFLLPPLQEQTAIASILSSLDDKIDLLHRQNKTLEQLAETLFRQWFVEEAEESWEEKTIGEITEIKAGGDKPQIFSELKTEKCNIPIYSNGITKDGLYGYTDSARINTECITISARGTIGFVCLRQEPFVPIVRLISIIPNENYLSSKYLYFWAKSQNIAGTGTTQEQLTIPDFSRTTMILPPFEKMNEFTNNVNTLFLKISNNQNQIRTLTQTRDTLLPKLMSGEVRVEM